ncbi:cold-shock protein [Streptomyces sp. NPDC055254]
MQRGLRQPARGGRRRRRPCPAAPTVTCPAVHLAVPGADGSRSRPGPDPASPAPSDVGAWSPSSPLRGGKRCPVPADARDAIRRGRPEYRTAPAARWQASLIPAFVPHRPAPNPGSGGTRRYGALYAVRADPLQSRGGPLLHAPAHALPTGGPSGGQCRLPYPTEREGGNMAPCGVVKWFDPERGIGLISQEGAAPDVQAEASACHGGDGLRQGEEVFFDVTLDSAGLRADNIRRRPRRQIQPPTRSGGPGPDRTAQDLCASLASGRWARRPSGLGQKD